VALWDLRKFTGKVHSFENHRDEVMGVQWSADNQNMFASTGKDKRVFVWNIKNIGNSEAVAPPHRQMPAGPEDDIDDAPPELHFIHGGHICTPNDISWNPHNHGLIASVCGENTLQVCVSHHCDVLFSVTFLNN